MMHPTALLFFLILTYASGSCIRGAYTSLFQLQERYVGEEFYHGFDFSTFDDPTHGRVNYVSQADAIQKNLTYASDTKFVMRADHTNVVPSGARGRDSVRIQSHAAHADSIVVLDLSHMPEGCSTWPAFWTISANNSWPVGGEIDGVNNNAMNIASLHTTPNCTMPTDNRPMTGSATSTNCDASVNFNQGCGVSFSESESYGSGLNAAGGGWYVMRRTSTEGISIWFWSRNDATVPPSVKYHKEIVGNDLPWRAPDAFFPATTSCSPDHFDAHQIIFDLTLCGDYAGALYPFSGCPGNCVDFVDNNPNEFVNAYWEINSLRVYTPL